MRRDCFGSCCAGIAIALVLLWGASASATSDLTLADLQEGESFLSGDETLKFDDFDIVVTGILDTDPVGEDELLDYEVVILEDGFRIVGPMGAADGNRGDILVSFNVWGLTAAIFGASSFFNGNALGTGALAAVEETLRELEGEDPQQPPIGSLFVAATGGSEPLKYDETSFDPVMHLRVNKDIIVDSDGGIISAISFVDQRYAVVPEPRTVLLVLGGLGMLAVSVRRQRR